MLTPIRVRGRRKKAPGRNASHGQGTQTTRLSGPKGGRPLMSRQARLDSFQSKSSQRARLWIAKPVKQRKRLSILETLPIELIENIFLYSLNVNFPRSSPLVAAAVSSERIYRALILLAFWNDDSPSAAYNDASSAISKILRPLEYTPLGKDERDALQNTILRCRWCTVSRLLNHVPGLMSLTISRHWFNAGIEMTKGQQESLDRFLSREEDSRDYEGIGRDNKQYTLSIVPMVSITISCEELDEQQTHKIIGIKTFPEKLLKGGRGEEEGFSTDHLKCLENLRIACGFNRSDHLETDITLYRESLQQGIHTALVENNAQALTTLLKIDEYVFRGNATMANGLPYTIPSEHFRTAVRVARNDPIFFQILLRASAESVPPDDEGITQWAMDLSDAFGHWLLDLMLELPRQIEAANANPSEAAVFYMGRANGQIEMARRYLNEVLNVEELPSWMEETTFDGFNQWNVSEIESES